MIKCTLKAHRPNYQGLFLHDEWHAARQCVVPIFVLFICVE